MWAAHIVMITFSIVLNWTIIHSGITPEVNKTDSDETPPLIASHMGLHCSLISHLLYNSLISLLALLLIGVKTNMYL